MPPGAHGRERASPSRLATSALSCARTSRAGTYAVSSHPLRFPAQQALADGEGGPGGGHQRVERDRHRGTSPYRLHELRDLVSLSLVLAAACSRGALAAAGPHGGLPEVVEPCAPASGRGVQRLLRIAGIPARDIADRSGGAVLELDGRQHVVVFRAGHGINTFWRAAGPPAEGVDEVAAFAREA